MWVRPLVGHNHNTPDRMRVDIILRLYQSCRYKDLINTTDPVRAPNSGRQKLTPSQQGSSVVIVVYFPAPFLHRMMMIILLSLSRCHASFHFQFLFCFCFFCFLNQQLTKQIASSLLPRQGFSEDECESVRSAAGGRVLDSQGSHCAQCSCFREPVSGL